MRILLVRHGESVWNRAGRIQGQATEAPGLTELGRRQAAEAAAALAGSGAELVMTSGLLRADETAAIIAERLGMPVEVDRRLMERSFGIAEGQLAEEFPEPAFGILQGVVVDPYRSPPGGESIAELRGRAAALFGELAGRREAEVVVLATHGGLVRAAQSLLAGEPLAQMPWRVVDNASVVEAVIGEG